MLRANRDKLEVQVRHAREKKTGKEGKVPSKKHGSVSLANMKTGVPTERTPYYLTSTRSLGL